MMNAGLLEAIVVDEWKAKMWAQVLPKITVHATIVLRERDQEGMGDPQEQPEARGGPERLLRELGQEGGRIPTASSST